jgi:outer membrane protein OmpA-like peptidoglycan-associated protein
MKSPFLKGLLAMFAFVLAACSTTPTTTPMLLEARAAYAAANSNTAVAQYAPLEFRDATVAMERANAAASKNESLAEIDKLAYLAKQKTATAVEIAKAKSAEANADAAARERDRIRLAARTAEADRAKAEAANAQSAAAAANAAAAAAQSQTADAQRRASDAEAAAREAQARLAQYEAVLIELHAQKTARGMMITISDVLFDVDQARLKPEGMANLRKLADVLVNNPNRNIMVEGFTDSTGSDAHNQQLSERRATAVRDALVGMGVGRERISMRGYGEQFPVASNDTAANRQLNRRVEILLSDEAGKIPPR